MMECKEKTTMMIPGYPDLESPTQTGQPLVSVIIRTYNRLPFLKEAVESVRNQTYRNWELIIVDDGSTDGTAEAVKQMDDQRIFLLSFPHSGNINYLVNEGAKICKGEWLSFLDSDDWWLPQKLEMQLKTLSASKKKWAYCPFEFIDDENKRTIYRSSEKFEPLQGNILREVIAAKTGITICSVMVEKRFFDEIGGFSPDPTLREDYEFFLRIASKAEVVFVPETLVQIREHSGRIYKSRKNPFERTARAYQAFIEQKPGRKFERLARRQVAHLLAEASVQRFANGERKKALQCLIQAALMKDKPRHWLSALWRGISLTYS